MIENEAGRKRFFDGTSFAPDAVIRDMAALVAATWSALEPIDPAQPSVDTRDERSYGAALQIIEDFRLRQALGEPQSPEALRWIAEALGRILEHKDPLHSLGLKPRPAHAPGDPQAAIDVVWWIACAENLGHDAKEAAGLAAEAFAKDLKSIQRYQAKAGEWTQGMNPDASAWARYFKARGKPLPEWNKKARLPVPTKKLR